MTLATQVWRGAKLASLVLAISAAALVIWLANGGADLPRHPRLVSVGTGFPDMLAGAEFTLAVSGAGGSPAQPQPWGIAFGPLRFLVHPDGYIFAGEGAPDWREFPHVKRWRNELYLHASEGDIAFYVNREFVVRLPVPAPGPVTLIGAVDRTALAITLWQPGW